MDKKKKIILTILLLVVVTVIVVSGTFAYFGWQAEEESIVNVTVSSGSGSCTLKSDNEVFIVPTSTREEGRIIKLNARQEMANKAYITWNLIVNSITGLTDESFKYEFINTTTGNSYGNGNFADTVADDTIFFSNDTEVLDYNVDYEFTLYLWIDGANFSNPTGMADQVFDFAMNCSITGTD